MGHFSVAEAAYLQEQRLGRMATTGSDGAPHVVPVVYQFDATRETLDIFGANLTGSKKYRDLSRDPRIALVVDDVAPPWQPRGIEIRGTVQLLLASDPTHEVQRDTIRVIPRFISAWGIETDPYVRTSRAIK